MNGISTTHLFARGVEPHPTLPAPLRSGFVGVCLLLVICLWGCERQEAGQEGVVEYQVEKKYDDDTVDFVLKIEKGEIAISDTFCMQLQAIADEGVDVVLPSVAQRLGEYDFAVIESETSGPKLQDDGRVVYRDTYLLEPVLPGTRQLPSLEIGYRVDAESGKLVTDPIAIEVTSPFDQETIAEEQIADIKPLVKVRFKQQWLWWWMALGGLVALAVVTFLIMGHRRKEERVKRLFKSAHQLAFERLAALERRELLAQGLFKPFYEEISAILRWYIEDRFGLQAPERTTEEFLQEAQDSVALNADHTEKLKKVLVHCDQVKFARYTPEPAEVNRSVELVREFIESTVDDYYQVDVTEGVARGTAVLVEVAPS